MKNLLLLKEDTCDLSAFQHRALDMNELAAEFRNLLNIYVRLSSDLSRISDAGQSDEDPQALIQSILDNRSCLTEIQQLNTRMTKLYSAWKNKEADVSLVAGDEIRSVVADVLLQLKQLEKTCNLGTQKVEARRKQLSEELANVGKGNRYLKLLSPRENYPKFIDSAC